MFDCIENGSFRLLFDSTDQMLAKILSRIGVWDSLLSSALIAPLGNLLQFLLTVVVARSLTVDGFGFFSFALQFANLLAILLGCGLPIYAQKLIPALRVNNEGELVNTYITWVGIWLGFSFVVVCICSVVALNVFDSLKTVAILLSVIPSMLWISQLYISLGFNRIPLALTPRDIVLPLLIIFILQLYTPETGLYLLVIYNIVLLLTITISGFFLFRSERISPDLSRLNVNRTFAWMKNSSPLAISSLSQFGLNSLDLIVLGVVGSMADAGAYAACMRVALVVSILNRITTIAVAHKLSAMHARNDISMVWKTYKQSMLMSISTGFIFLLVICFFGEKILAIFGSNNYAQFYPVLVILSLGNFIACLVGPVVAGHNMIGNQNYVAKSQFIWIILALIFYFILIPRYSLYGAALVTAATQSLMRLRQFYVLYNKLTHNHEQKTLGV